ncbi:light-harvesting antenna LH1, alpha subunit [Thiobaca trueperi]|uniref:Light-harvesting protein B-800-850 alpha chain n=1 Tax=Thiobaca trueperi TaxID=127458 RepID=A0A4R3MVY4_9GAMM|nr:light-harvesting antenna LH1, alpha subunit [Thiobaca trueperi]TCT20718.1 light-harvesting protein B-800-850 alpha chain [Thiobaca trueperi]
MQFMGYNPTENDYKFWLVVNPSTWLIPTLFAVLVTAILIHVLAYSLPGQAYRAKPAVEAAAPAAAPAATPAG